MTTGTSPAAADPGAASGGRRPQGTRALRQQVARVLLGAVLVPILTLAVLQTAYEYSNAQRQQQERVRVAVRVAATSIDQFVEAHASAVALAADEASEHADSPNLDALRTLFPAFITTLATDAEGRIIAAEPRARAAGATHRSVADRSYFRVPAAEMRAFVSDAFVGRGMGTDPLVAMSAPVVINGRFAGIVEGSIKVDTFTALGSGALRARGQEMLVLDRAGRVIHASAGLPLAFQQSLANARFLRGQEGLDGVSAAMLDTVTIPGRSAWVAWSQLHSGWRVAVFEPRESALSGVWRRASQTVGFLLLALAVVLVLANVQIRRLEQALHSTLENLRAVAAGERSPRAPIENVPAELKPVAEQVVHLAEQLQDANADLKTALAAQQALAARLQAANDRLEATVDERTAELALANRDLERLSQTDPLTAALNVRGLNACYAQSTSRLGHLLADAAVVVFDVDFFKPFNDRYGHPAGDQVLRRIAATALAAVRGGADRVARVGGEEFLVFLPHADAERALQVAERIRIEVHALGIPHLDGCNGRVTVSLGVAVGSAGEAVETVVGRADEALYRAKASGRNRTSH